MADSNRPKDPSSPSRSSQETYEIVGTTLEGGGQLVRTALALSALTTKPITISHIRGNRSGGGGLKGQHLTAMQWLAAATGAAASLSEVDDSKNLWKVGDKSCTFCPGTLPPQAWWHLSILPDGTPCRATEVNMETPGAVTLVLQTILPFLLFSPPENSADPAPILLTVRGGTNVPWSPSIDYVEQVLLPNLKLMFSNFPEVTFVKGGKFGKIGGKDVFRRRWSTGKGRPEVGVATFVVNPLSDISHLQTAPFDTVPLKNVVRRVTVTVLAPDRTREYISECIVRVIQSRILSSTGKPVDVDLLLEDSKMEGRIYVLAVATVDGDWKIASDCLVGSDWTRAKGRQGTPRRSKGTNREDVRRELEAIEAVVKDTAEQVVKGLEQELLNDIVLDHWMQDQVVVFQALAKGQSCLPRKHGTSSWKRKHPHKEPNLSQATLHTLTARWIAKELLNIDFQQNGGCKGAQIQVSTRALQNLQAQVEEMGI